jgi:two-component system, OmpR family, sensor kinase
VALLRPRLALRIYLAGLAQFAVVLLGFGFLMWANQSMARAVERDARAAVEQVVGSLEDPAALARELGRVETVLDATIVIYDDGGQVLATNRRRGDKEPPELLGPPPPFHLRGKGRVRPLFPGAPPPPYGFGAAPLLPPLGPPMLAFMMPVQLPNGHPGRAFYAARDLGPPAILYVAVGFVLVVIGLASFFTARSLAKPLTRLSTAAQRFGAGELETRVRLERADEIGEVARAFDEMAERITNLVRAEKELIANVSHELRTPLARIRVALDLAAEGDPNVARQLLGEIGQDLGELEQLISDVLVASHLDLAKLSISTANGVLPLHKDRLEISDLMERAAVRFRSAHPDRPLTVNTAQERAIVEGDPVLLRRALENLLENAHKYTSPEGAIDVASGVDANWAWIDVRDQGIGIAPDDLPHVFRPFFRADKSRTRATGGLGLGLALVKRIAEAHRGAVAIESQIGTGTRVRIRLPVVDERPRSSSGASSQS